MGLCPWDMTFTSVSYPPSPLLGERAMLNGPEWQKCSSPGGIRLLVNTCPMRRGLFRENTHIVLHYSYVSHTPTRVLWFLLVSSPWEPWGASRGKTQEGTGGPWRQHPPGVCHSQDTPHSAYSSWWKPPFKCSSLWLQQLLQQMCPWFSGFTRVSSVARMVHSATWVSWGIRENVLILFFSHLSCSCTNGSDFQVLHMSEWRSI